MRRMFLGLVLAGLAVAAPAAAVTFTVTPGTVQSIGTNNHFKSQLNALGLSYYTHKAGTAVSLSGPATLTFEYLGSESGFKNKFTVTGLGGFAYQELTNGVEAWNAAGLDIGTPLVYALGGLISNWQFSSPGQGTPGPYGIGTEQFGIFMGARTGHSSSVLYLGYDDEPGSDDDNHDDMIIRITATDFVDPQGVPEPASWAMLIAGFGLVGAAQRKRKVVVTA